ncbi:MAG: hypothetical protein A2Y25_06655 [Candidatus Melainabacteria bacterium GWF2_37_15]|nr:MAG: hypothetical protein A2Y25_06655 [Candidatus Melainabacteria bacterium GWF2_37_15]
MDEFIKNAQILDITNEIIETAIKIRQKAKIKSADAIIAATAFNNKLTLVTRDNKDFHKVKGLSIYNPFEA